MISTRKRFPLPRALAMLICLASLPAVAQTTFSETKDTRSGGSGGNDSKTTAETINLGTVSSATISGYTTGANISTSTGYVAGADNTRDYYKVTTAYQTPGIYVNTLDLTASPGGTGGTSFLGRLRGLSQTSGVIAPGTDVPFQTSASSGTSTPYGLNRWYSFGGSAQAQSVYYAVDGQNGGGSYTAQFSSQVITPTYLGRVSNAGSFTIAAAANLNNQGNATNLSAVVLDSNFNLYVDPTTGFAASNDNPGAGIAGFSMTRNFTPGTYYLAVAISNLATNQAAAADDAVRSNAVLDFDNVLATNNTFYNGAGGVTRPADFTIKNTVGATTVTTSSQVIDQLYGVNFYRFDVVVQPEPTPLALLVPLGIGLIMVRLRRRSPNTA